MDPTHLGLQPFCFQQMYAMAVAERMRMVQPFPALQHFNTNMLQFTSKPPADLAMFPMAKLDPRLFRIPFPEEPKPQHSYIGLIAMAILRAEGKKLVLADIYQYLLDNFAYFRHRGPGWRNSIRHNLSLNDCFIKAGRASNGKGHFWAVHPACQEDFLKGDFSRRKAQRKFRKYISMNISLEEDQTPPSSPTNLLDISPSSPSTYLDTEVDGLHPEDIKVEDLQTTWFIQPAIKPENIQQANTNFSIANLLA